MHRLQQKLCVFGHSQQRKTKWRALNAKFLGKFNQNTKKQSAIGLLNSRFPITWFGWLGSTSCFTPSWTRSARSCSLRTGASTPTGGTPTTSSSSGKCGTCRCTSGACDTSTSQSSGRWATAGDWKGFFKPHSHPNGFYCGHQCSWTLTPANSIQVSIIQSDNCNWK